MSKTILVYIEKNNEVSMELAKKAQELACKINKITNTQVDVAGLMIAESNFINESETFFDKIYTIFDSKFKNYSTEMFSKSAIDLIKQISPEIFLIGATCEGRDLAPRISSSLKTGLTADCTELEIDEKGKLAATRPTFGGKLMATILSKNLPQMATVRPHVIKTEHEPVLKKTSYINIQPDIDGIKSSINLVSYIEKEKTSSIEDAQIIVAGGKGMKDNLDLLKKFADKIGGVVGVSRAIVDLGLANPEIQIGQTGKTITPKIYIACGISGAIQHTVGIMGAEKIIAINTDKNAPIFKYADYGIVGDCVKILKNIVENM